MKKVIITFILILVYLISAWYFIECFNSTNAILISIIGTVFGGLLLSLIYFVLYEFLYQIPNLAGKWECIEKTLITSYNPYQNMEVKYLVIIWNEGRNIYGSGEKVKEQNRDGNLSYEGKERVNIEIKGHYNKKYFWNDEIIIHYMENGKERKSSTIHKLKVNSKLRFEGKFFKTAANASGNSLWEKKEKEFN